MDCHATLAKTVNNCEIYNKNKLYYISQNISMIYIIIDFLIWIYIICEVKWYSEIIDFIDIIDVFYEIAKNIIAKAKTS